MEDERVCFFDVFVILFKILSAQCEQGHVFISLPYPSFPNLIYFSIPLTDYTCLEDHDCQNLIVAGIETPLNTIGKPNLTLKIPYCFHFYFKIFPRSLPQNSWFDQTRCVQ